MRPSPGVGKLTFSRSQQALQGRPATGASDSAPPKRQGKLHKADMVDVFTVPHFKLRGEVDSIWRVWGG